jgi:integrase
MLRNALDFAISMGVRLDNPAMGVMRLKETTKPLTLPTADQFDQLLITMASSGSRDSRNCADLVRFLAFSGFRKGEAAHVRWAGCDFIGGTITARGPETGLKNRLPGEVRVVPMITEMRTLLERLRNERPPARGCAGAHG